MRKYPNRIREFRKNRRLTQQQVADATGTTHQQIQRLELGERQLTEFWMKRISPVFGCLPGDLMLGGRTTGTGDQCEALVACYYKMTPENRTRLLDIAKILAHPPHIETKEEPDSADDQSQVSLRLIPDP